LIEEKSKGAGGQSWIQNFNKSVFEKKKGFYHYARADKKKKWEEPSIQREFDKDKKENRWLVQSRNRLLRLYDMVSRWSMKCTFENLCASSLESPSFSTHPFNPEGPTPVPNSFRSLPIL
jgi:hypothetical protein